LAKYEAHYLSECIERIRREAAVHGEKFAGVEVHNDCMKRFDSVIAALEKELADARSEETKV
jgi:hypothetical protein